MDVIITALLIQYGPAQMLLVKNQIVPLHVAMISDLELSNVMMVTESTMMDATKIAKLNNGIYVSSNLMVVLTATWIVMIDMVI